MTNWWGCWKGWWFHEFSRKSNREVWSCVDSGALVQCKLLFVRQPCKIGRHLLWVVSTCVNLFFKNSNGHCGSSSQLVGCKMNNMQYVNNMYNMFQSPTMCSVAAVMSTFLASAEPCTFASRQTSWHFGYVHAASPQSDVQCPRQTSLNLIELIGEICNTQSYAIHAAVAAVSFRRSRSLDGTVRTGRYSKISSRILPVVADVIAAQKSARRSLVWKYGRFSRSLICTLCQMLGDVQMFFCWVTKACACEPISSKAYDMQCLPCWLMRPSPRRRNHQTHPKNPAAKDQLEIKRPVEDG